MKKNSNVLVINGSPHQHGKLSQITNNLTNGMCKWGCKIDTIWIPELNLEYCIGCMKCQEKGRCLLRNDDIPIVEQKIKSADILILATPVHWGNISSHMLQLFERLFGFLIQERPAGIPLKRAAKGKKAIFITSCSTPYPFNWIFNQSRAVFSRMHEICKYSGIKVIKKIALPGTADRKNISKKFLAKIERIGNSLSSKA